MIFELRVKNFLSFKGEEVLSFEATDDTDLEETHVVEVAPGVRILRMAVVYGANASGKSNLLSVFSLLSKFWFHVTRDRSEHIGIMPFSFDDETIFEPSEFTMVFYASDRRKYVYELKADDEKVHYESLKVYPQNRPVQIFERTLNKNFSKIVFNENLVIIRPVAKEEISIKCLRNMSVLAAYNAVNFSVPELDVFVEEINKLHYLLPIGSDFEKRKNWEGLLKMNNEDKKDLLAFLQTADYNISGFKIKELDIPDTLLQELMDKFGISYEKAKNLVEKERDSLVQTVFKHKIKVGNEYKTYDLNSIYESDGTLWSMKLYEFMKLALDREAFLQIDEIETSLHPNLLELLIYKFLSTKSEAQLIFTTHYDGLLANENLLRKDSVWFTQKREDGSTELYSLSDFKDVDKLNYLDKAYKYGRFGAVPNI